LWPAFRPTSPRDVRTVKSAGLPQRLSGDVPGHAGNSDRISFGYRAKVQPPPISPRISYTSRSADAVALAAVGVADGELAVGIGVEADIPVHVNAQAATQLQARGLLQ